MTPPASRSSFPERRGWRGAIAAGLLTAAAAMGVARPAAGQACCAGGAVVTPTRLAPYEDVAVGIESRTVSALGSYTSDGRYASSSTGEQELEQNLAASVRLTHAAQVGLVARAIETHRQIGTADEWGGGFGDLSLSARYDLLLPSERPRLPGIGVLAGATLPTGTPTDAATQPLATDATGLGSWDASLGVSFEKAFGAVLAGVSLWGTYRFARTISIAGTPPVSESFGLRASWLAFAGYVFESESTVALYTTGFEEGDATIAGVRDASTGRRLTTLGAAGVLPFGNVWRARAALHADLPVSALGRNQRAGAGATISLVRVWF